MNEKRKNTIVGQQEEYRSFLEAFAMKATQHIGSTMSLILHSAFFVGIFSLRWFGFSLENIMLILTTVVSLEAIYLSIFIQLTINRQSRQIEGVSEEVEEISKDIDEIQEDVGEIQEEAKEISADVEGIHGYIESIEENVEELSEELEKDDATDAAERTADMQKIDNIENVLEELLREVKRLKG